MLLLSFNLDFLPQNILPGSRLAPCFVEAGSVRLLGEKPPGSLSGCQGRNKGGGQVCLVAAHPQKKQVSLASQLLTPRPVGEGKSAGWGGGGFKVGIVDWLLPSGCCRLASAFPKRSRKTLQKDLLRTFLIFKFCWNLLCAALWCSS